MEGRETNLSNLAPHPPPYPAVADTQREFPLACKPALGVAAAFVVTCRLYWRHRWSFVGATATVVVPVAGLSCVLRLILTSPDFQLGVRVASSVMGATASLLAGLVVVRIAWQSLRGRPMTVRTAAADVLSRFWALSWLATLYSVAVSLAAVTVVGIPLALYLGSGWALCLQVGLLEGRSGRVALDRSAELVGGHRRDVLAVMLVITASGSILVNAPAGIAGLAMGTQESAELANVMLLALGESLAGPLAWIAGTILYDELRRREFRLGLEQPRATAEQGTRPTAGDKPLPYGSLALPGAS